MSDFCHPCGPLSSTVSWVSPCPLESADPIYKLILILCCPPLPLPSVFPSIRPFQWSYLYQVASVMLSLLGACTSGLPTTFCVDFLLVDWLVWILLPMILRSFSIAGAAPFGNLAFMIQLSHCTLHDYLRATALTQGLCWHFKHITDS